jgi:transcriptional regulator with PAS, ATPase and Fis domain
LDEIGECDPAMQAKLLRVLQPPDQDPCHRAFYRVGDSKPITSSVRIIAATNRDLFEAVSGQKFRADLYYRLAVISIKLPPLRDRREDIPLIAANLLDRINRNFEDQEPGFKHKSVSGSATEFVKKYPWPGNVRQLYNTMIQAAVMTDEDIIERSDFVEALAEVPGKPTIDLLEVPLGEGFSLEAHLEEIQRHYLRRAIAEAKGVKKRAAELLGYRNYQTLAAQIDRLGVEPPAS